jgi:hypothetical protein
VRIVAVNVQGLRTVVVHVADVSRAAAFYEHALGLPRVYDKGVPVLQEATDEPWGDAAVLDPDGYPVYLTQLGSGGWTSGK